MMLSEIWLKNKDFGEFKIEEKVLVKFKNKKNKK